MAAFITPNALVTVRKGEGFAIDQVVERWDQSTDLTRVTSWAAIIAVPTAITGFYGQNVPYPGFGSHAGFWTSTLVTLLLSGLLYLVFRRKGWI